jgi:hypothetical protein
VEKPDATAVNDNDEGDTVIVGGGVQPRTTFTAGVFPRFVVKVVFAVVEVVVGSVR